MSSAAPTACRYGSTLVICEPMCRCMPAGSRFGCSAASRNAAAASSRSMPALPPCAVSRPGCVSVGTCTSMRGATAATRSRPAATSPIRPSSCRESTMKARTPQATARARSRPRVFATPLNTICRGSNPARQRLVELAAGVDLDVRAGVPHHAEEPEVGAGLARVEDLGGRMHAAERAHHGLDVGAQPALAEHEERGLARPRQLDEVGPVEAEVAVADGVQRIGGRHALPLLVEWAVSEVYCARFVPPATGETDRVVDASPHDRRRTAFTGGKVHDF